MRATPSQRLRSNARPMLSCVLCLGCASTIDGTRSASDASAADVATPTVDVPLADVTTTDLGADAVVATALLRVRVALGPLEPTRPGANFRVRAQGVGGVFVEGVTDDTGYVEIVVPSGAAPFDVTVARAGHTAVSVMGVPVPYALEVYARPASLARPSGVTNHLVRGSITGRQSPFSRVVLQGFEGTHHSVAERYEMGFETWPDAPALRPLAIEYDNDMRIVNAVAPEPVRAEDTDINVDFALPSTPVMVEGVNLGVEFPFQGMVTPSTFNVMHSQGVVRFVPSSTGPRALNYGTSQLRPPNDAGLALWHIDSLTGPLIPELYWAVWTHRGPQELRASVALRPPFRGLRPSVSVIEELSVTTDGTETRLNARTIRYDRHAFDVRPVDDSIDGRWVGYPLRGADTTHRALPSLPTGITLDSLFPGVVSRQTRVTICALRALPMAVAPWRSAQRSVVFDNEVSVCTINGPAALLR